MSMQVRSLSYLKLFGFILLTCLALLLFLLNKQFVSANSEQCHIFNDASQVSQFGNFGSPFYEVGDRSLLVKAGCVNNMASIEVGNGQSNMYIFNTAYVWNTNTKKWESRTLSSSGSHTSGSWIAGKANLNNVNVNTYEAVAVYICTFESEQWKCGCRDQECSGSSARLWQLQRLSISNNGSTGHDNGSDGEYEIIQQASVNFIANDFLPYSSSPLRGTIARTPGTSNLDVKATSRGGRYNGRLYTNTSHGFDMYVIGQSNSLFDYNYGVLNTTGNSIEMSASFTWLGGVGEIDVQEHAIVAFTQGHSQSDLMNSPNQPHSQAAFTHGAGAYVRNDGLNLELWDVLSENTIIWNYNGPCGEYVQVTGSPNACIHRTTIENYERNPELFSNGYITPYTGGFLQPNTEYKISITLTSLGQGWVNLKATLLK